MENAYAIQEYGSDGSGYLSGIEDGFTLQAARNEIWRRVGKHGDWRGETDNDPAGWRTVEVWHASDDEGCGGYSILRKR